MKCVICPGFITSEDEYVRFYKKPHHKRKSSAHLRCFVGKHFVTTESFECTPSDVVIVSAFEICAWCRKLGVVVARMPRTNQAICNTCCEIIGKLLSQSDAKQILENASLESGQEPEVLAVVPPEKKN